MKNNELEILKLCIPIALGLIVWYVQKAKELRMQRSQYNRQKNIDALMAIWGLLRFMAQNENVDTVYIKKEMQCLLRVKQANAFLNAFKEVYYTQGHGLYLNAALKKELFYWRGATYTILKAENKFGIEGTTEDHIKIKNKTYQKELFDTRYHIINELLKKELESIR